MSPPPVRYARAGDDLSIAYQVVGEGPVDLVFDPPVVSHLEIMWEHPRVARFLSQLASFSRLILFDRRGVGLSDRVASSSFEDAIEDVTAVLDEVGSERATYFGCDAAGRRAVMFAAAHPERCSGLVLFGAHPASFADPPDYPWGAPREELDTILALVDTTWGAPDSSLRLLEQMDPEMLDDEQTCDWVYRLTRAIGRREALVQIGAVVTADVRPLLATIHVPALVMHRTDDTATSIEASRYMADRIPGATFVVLPGRGHMPYFDHPDELVDEVRHFLTGTRAVVEPDRVLATILFSDIVGSTETAARVGDRRWRELLDAHDRVVQMRLQEYRGRYVKNTGDGFLASFDAPARAIRCALSIRDGVHAHGIETRSGLHTGEVELRGDDLGGIAVHIGARVAARAGTGEVLVSRTVADLVAGSEIDFVDRGAHELKGVPGTWNLFAVNA